MRIRFFKGKFDIFEKRVLEQFDLFRKTRHFFEKCEFDFFKLNTRISFFRKLGKSYTFWKN